MVATVQGIKKKQYNLKDDALRDERTVVTALTLMIKMRNDVNTKIIRKPTSNLSHFKLYMDIY